jgi:hypothetical protein
MQTDCAAWLDEIETEVPSVSFEVRSGGKALAAVRVFEGERVFAERADGAALELDPGAHWLRFEAQGHEPVAKQILLERGAKNQHFVVELPEVPPPRRAPATPAPAPARSGSAAPWVAGAIGLAGITAFGILGATGRAQEASLEQRCAPNCGEADVRSVQTKYLLADISLAVGIGGFLVGGYFLLAPHEPPSGAQVSSVQVRATPHGVTASVRSTF